MSAASRLSAAGLRIPEPSMPRGKYVPFRKWGSLVFVAGQGPAYAESAASYGKVGADLSVEEGVNAAGRAALSVLSVLREACAGDLERVVQCVQLLGYVNSAPGFTQQSAVIDGATAVLELAFGDSGLPARAAVSAPELPRSIAVELVCVFGISGGV